MSPVQLAPVPEKNIRGTPDTDKGRNPKNSLEVQKHFSERLVHSLFNNNGSPL